MSRFRENQLVYIKHRGRWRQAKFIAYTGFNDAVKISMYEGGLTCSAAELIDFEQRQDMKAAEQKEKARRRLSEVIAHWETGRRTAKEMLSTSKTGTLARWSREIRDAKKWGFIVEEKKSGSGMSDDPRCSKTADGATRID